MLNGEDKIRHASSRVAAQEILQRSFFKRVYPVVRRIPSGKVLTYGQIATLLGAPYMARQVGWAREGAPSRVAMCP